MPAKLMLLAIGLGVGGTEMHVLELASRIDRSRFDVTVCTLKSGGKIAEELCARGVRVISLDGSGKLDARVFFRLLNLIRAERPDIIQAFLFWANMAVRACRRFLGAFSVVSSYHDEIVSEGRIVRLVDRLTLKWTDAVVCCSEAVRRSVVTQIGGSAEACTIIPFGVDVERFVSQTTLSRRELGLHSDGPIVGTVCRLVEPKKGLRVLLEAFAQLQRVHGVSGCQLLIVGDGPARTMLESLRDRLGLTDRVIFAGTRRDLPQVLSMLDVFVLPSLYEGFGIAILEAMAAGKPVIATTVGGIPEFVEQARTGVLVPPGDSMALASAIKDMIVYPARAKSMGCHAQAYVRKHHTIEAIVRQHEDLYELCLSQM